MWNKSVDVQNLGYALTQVVHNFGASAVIGGAIASLWLAPRPEMDRSLGWLVLSGWAAQMASGATFGAISFYYYGQFPDIITKIPDIAQRARIQTGAPPAIAGRM